MVGHDWENMGTMSNGGQGRKESVGWKQNDVCGGHGMAIGQANGVTGSDWTFVDARSVGASSEMLGISHVGYSVKRFIEH